MKDLCGGKVLEVSNLSFY